MCHKKVGWPTKNHPGMFANQLIYYLESCIVIGQWLIFQKKFVFVDKMDGVILTAENILITL